MPAKATKLTRSEKLDLRLTQRAKRTLQMAAAVRHKSVTEFVLDSALTAAEDVLGEQRSIRLSPEQWKAFVQALDAPPLLHPRMERLLTEKSVFD